MLQQTQASTVIPYYLAFIDRFPNAIDLADAPLDEALRLWMGLGYYSRARNLHRAAQIIRDELNGAFPRTFDEVLALPGVGRSTAGAICALAYGMKTPILDGNAKRVYARCFCVDDEKDSQRTRRLWEISEAAIPEKDCQKYTQYIMDLGAMVCTPKNPVCDECPVSSVCCAKAADLVDILPLRKRSADRKQKSTTMIMAMNRSGAIMLERRPSSGIWGGLWSFPEYSGPIESVSQWFMERYTVPISILQSWDTFHHDFTHYRLNITPLMVRVEDLGSHQIEHLDIGFVPVNGMLDRGVPAPVAALIERIQKSEFNPQL